MRYNTKQNLLTFIPTMIGFIYGFTLIGSGKLIYGLIFITFTMTFLICCRIFDMNNLERCTLNHRGKDDRG